MATNDKQEQTGPAAPVSDAEKNKRDVADFLSAPRKKRRSYVVLACGRTIPGDLRAGMEQFVRANFKNVAVSVPPTPEELMKQFTRQIVLLVMDDEFAEERAVLEMIRDLKRRKNSIGTPVLFLTRQPEKLVELYNEILLPFHESDDFIVYPKASPAHVFSKIKSGLTTKNRRRSRRYKIDLPIAYFMLTENAMFKGRLLDLSVHGALIKADDNRIFRDEEQLKLNIPISDFLPPVEGDYLKLSARVRRVFISGSLAGVSFEYVSEKQQLTLTTYLTEAVNQQNLRRLASMRPRTAR